MKNKIIFASVFLSLGLGVMAMVSALGGFATLRRKSRYINIKKFKRKRYLIRERKFSLFLYLINNKILAILGVNVLAINKNLFSVNV